MYREVGVTDALDYLQGLAAKATWKTVKGSGRDYETSFLELDAAQRIAFGKFGPPTTAFFLKIPPGGRVHKHIDADDPKKTYHFVVQTNPDCVSYMASEPYHLEEGHIYEVNRQVEHWSENNGDTDRIHLLVEVYE